MPSSNLTGAIIRRNATAQAFQQGEEYYHQGCVDSLVHGGNTLHAELKGSQGIPYRVAVTFEQDQDVDAICSCQADYNGWCRHIVAALLAFLNASPPVQEQPTLADLLSQLNREQLQSLLLKVSERHPDLTDEIVAQCYRLLTLQAAVHQDEQL